MRIKHKTKRIVALLLSISMALLWNLFAAGPLTRLIFRGVCRRNIQLKSAEDSI